MGESRMKALNFSGHDNYVLLSLSDYLERVVKEDLQPVKEPYYNIKCAGGVLLAETTYEMR